jgi:hypothetical protein
MNQDLEGTEFKLKISPDTAVFRILKDPIPNEFKNVKWVKLYIKMPPKVTVKYKPHETT